MLSIRKIGLIGRTYRHLNRYSQVLTILMKYGFGNVVERLKIDQYIDRGLEIISGRNSDHIKKLTQPERIRLLVEELGPTFIKMGQILSMRPDLLPPDLIEELFKLQDDVPPFPFDDVQKIIRRELKETVDTQIQKIYEKPVAAASIGQVHRAELKNGEIIALKIQRPGIKKILEIDLEIILHLATLMERHIEEVALYNPVEIVEEFTRTIEKEIDYTIESSNMEHMSRQFISDSSVYIPKVYHELSSENVLALEFIDGIKISHEEKLDQAGFDKKLIVKRGADFVYAQIFEHGFFHADPHPGNIFVLPDNVICLIDFGMVGSVDKYTRSVFIDLVSSALSSDFSQMEETLLELTDYETEPDHSRLKRDLSDFTVRHIRKRMENLNVGQVISDLMEILIRHKLKLNSDIFLMMKSLASIDGTVKQLDPEFDITEHIQPFVKKIAFERYSPKAMSRQVLKSGSDLLKFIKIFPKDLMSITRQLQKNSLGITIDIKGINKLMETYNQISNRIAFSIITAALIIGSALILISKIPPIMFGVSVLGVAGFIAAAFMGLWLLIAIIKKGNL